MIVFKRAILPKKFKANGVACGIKKSGNSDLALFYSEVPAIAASKSTANKIQAAPLKANQAYFKKTKQFRGIIVNSGNANAFTGKAGIKDAFLMGKLAADCLSVKDGSVLVASTGVIGKKLPVEKIKQASHSLVEGLSIQGIDKAKRAIITTDKFTKEITVKFKLGSKEVTLCAVAKGAGMIAPNMATMLCFVFTDANISQQALSRALSIAVDNSFNCITVDGCMSTNDTVIILANKACGNKSIISGNAGPFLKALKIACLELAKMIVSDGEGSTKLIRIKVNQAKNYQEAKKIALSIANSNLFKTAMYASSPNCLGRIAASAGAAGVDIKEPALKIKFSNLNKKDVDIDVSVGRGKASAVIYASDLSHEYIRINAEYN